MYHSHNVLGDSCVFRHRVATQAALVSIVLGLILIGAPPAWPTVTITELIQGNMVAGDVYDQAITPDGTTLVYSSDQDTNNVIELYSVPLAGGTPTRISAPLPHGHDVRDFVISPDGNWAVYRVEFGSDEAEGLYELHSAAIAGGGGAQLNGTLPLSGSVLDYTIASDSSRVVYRADQDLNDVAEVYSVPIAGGAGVKLNEALVAGGEVDSYAVSPDGATVVYRADQDVDGEFTLRSVPIGGGAPLEISPVLSDWDETESNYAISPDSSSVVYIALEPAPDVYALYSVPIGGGTPVKLNASFASAGGVVDFIINPSSTTVVYRAFDGAQDAYELSSVPMGGGTAVKLNPPLVYHGDVSERYAITSDGNTVIYLADQDTNETDELYSVPIGGGTAVRLNGALEGYPYFDTIRDFDVSGDGSVVLYLMRSPDTGYVEIHASPATGGTAVRVTDGADRTSGIDDYAVTADSSAVVFRVAIQVDDYGIPQGGQEIYSVPIGGGTSVKLNTALPEGGNVDAYVLNPDSATVVYRADQDTLDVIEVYAVPVGGGSGAKLSGTMTRGGVRVADFQLSPDGAYALIRCQRETDGPKELFSVLLPDGTPVRLNAPLPPESDVYEYWAISPDITTVVYRADQDTEGIVELYSVPIDGGAPTKISGPMGTDGNVLHYPRISPDSSMVIYTADQDTDEVYELYSVPIGGGVTTKLNGPLVAEGDVLFQGYQFTPDGATVVYLADQDTDGVDQLYSVPSTGGTVSALTFPILREGEVVRTNYKILPDSSGIVYEADEVDNGQNVRELYSVPIEGGPRVRLDTGQMASWLLSGDGLSVVFRASHEVGAEWMTELYSVPSSGGTPVRLNADLPQGGGVSSFVIAADDSTVVYLSNQETADSFMLYRVPIEGGVAPVKIAPATGTAETVDSLSLPPGSDHIRYRGAHESGEETHYTYYTVPATGGPWTAMQIPSGPEGMGGLPLSHWRSQTSPTALLYYLAVIDYPAILYDALYSIPMPGGTYTRRDSRSHTDNYGWWPSAFRPGTEDLLYQEASDGDVLSSLYLSTLSGPTVSVDQAATQSDPTGLSRVVFDVVFSAPVTGFDDNDADDVDVVIEGTAVVTGYTITPAGGGDRYTLTVDIDTAAEGTVIAFVPQDAAQDAALDTNIGSSSTDNLVVYQDLPPQIAIGRPRPRATTGGTVEYTLEYTDAVSVSLTADDITIIASGTATADVTVSNGTTLNPTVTLTSVNGEGALAIAIGPGTAVDSSSQSALEAGPSDAVMVSVDFTSSVHSTSGAPVPIPDSGSITSTLTIPAGSAVQIADIDVTLNITHPHLADLAVSLTAPMGIPVQLIPSNGLSGADFSGTILDDAAANPLSAGSAPFTGRFRPGEPLAPFYGNNSEGLWTLTITDTAPGSVGTLDGWELDIVGTAGGWPLILDPIPNQTLAEGVQWSFGVSVSDPVAALTLLNAPDGATLHDWGYGTATITWTPSPFDAGLYQNLEVRATNGARQTSALFDIDVSNTPAAPKIGIEISGPRDVEEGQTATFTCTIAHDAASDGTAVRSLNIAELDHVGAKALAYVGGDDGDGWLEASEEWTYEAVCTYGAGDFGTAGFGVAVTGEDGDGELTVTEAWYPFYKAIGAPLAAWPLGLALTGAALWCLRRRTRSKPAQNNP